MFSAVRHPRRSASGRTQPYLESLAPSTAGEVVALEWARYLVETFGTAGAIRALRYYEDVHWISRSVRRAMVEYVRSTARGDLDEDQREGLSDPLASLDGSPFEEHARSLEYVAAIADDSLAAELQSIRLPSTGTGGEPTGTTGAESPSTEPTADEATDASADSAEQVGVAGGIEDAARFHLLSDDGTRSLCGTLDSASETTPDVAEVHPRDVAMDAGLSLCGHCRNVVGE